MCTKLTRDTPENTVMKVNPEGLKKRRQLIGQVDGVDAGEPSAQVG
jgi:hypothetical protein